MNEKNINLQKEYRTIQKGWNPSETDNLNQIIEEKQLSGNPCDSYDTNPRVSSCDDYDSCPGD